MTVCVAMVVLGPMRVVAEWMVVCGAMREGEVEIFWGCESGVAGTGEVVWGMVGVGVFIEGGRVARWREVWRRRWGVSTRRIRGVEVGGVGVDVVDVVGVVVGWM